MKRVGLALGGGGVRGLVHIAYLEVLEKMGITPAVISGTSMGAMVGVMAAGGMHASEMIALMPKLAARPSGKKCGTLFSRLDRMPAGMRTEWVKRFLADALPVTRLEDAAIPVKVTATDYHTLDKKVFTRGSALDAVMASIALPGTFPPYPIGPAYYIDGGAVDLVPFDIIRDDCDILAAIDAAHYSPDKKEQPPDEKDASTAAWSATMKALITYQRGETPVEIYEEPAFPAIPATAFDRYETVYQIGRQRKPAFRKKLERLLE